MKKLNGQTSIILLFIISVVVIESCSKKSQSLDDKYLERVQTLDGTIDAFYSAISANDGIGLNWELYEYTMHPKGKLIAYEPDKENDYKTYSLTFYTADSYIERYQKYMENVGFYERELFRKVTTFGPISHVLSGYASFESGVEKPIIRGINSFQMLNDGNRWWILNAYYTRETPENPIPEKYLTKEYQTTN